MEYAITRNSEVKSNGGFATVYRYLKARLFSRTSKAPKGVQECEGEKTNVFAGSNRTVSRSTRSTERSGSNNDSFESLDLNDHAVGTSSPGVFSAVDASPRRSERQQGKRCNVPPFSWSIAKAYMDRNIYVAETFELGGVLYGDWRLQQIPTLGAYAGSRRIQKLFEATIDSSHGPLHLFIKKVQYSMWEQQFSQMEQYFGEYVTDGENFVMEAAVLSYFKKFCINIAPRLVGILLEHENGFPSNICIVSELYGEDVLYYLKRHGFKGTASFVEKHSLQHSVFKTVRALHKCGLCHLDITPENILIGFEGVKLCDFAKATPIESHLWRHVESPDNCNTLKPFESCEPTVGKAAYMPPECWKIYRLIEDRKIQSPLKALAKEKSPERRASFYFKVEKVDIFMLGVFFFWVWAEGGIWKLSDPTKDLQFRCLAKHDMNVDVFLECRSWPVELKRLLKKTLHKQPSCRIRLEQLSHDPWWKWPS